MYVRSVVKTYNESNDVYRIVYTADEEPKEGKIMDNKPIRRINYCFKENNFPARLKSFYLKIILLKSFN